MKKLILAAMLGVGLSAADAAAQYGPPMHEMGGPVMPGGDPPGGNRYGWNPVLKKLFWWKKDDCGTGHCGKGGCNVPAPPGAPGGPQVGTLVFPNHPFVRSPRDFFMYGQGGY